MFWKMKKLALILCTAVLLSAAASCDMIRKIAGRPSAADVEVYHQIELAEKARLESAAADSLLAVQDSLRALDSLAAHGIRLNPKSRTANFSQSTLPARYAAIVGVYGKNANSTKHFSEMSSEGCHPVLIPGAATLSAVAIFPSNTIAGLWEQLEPYFGKGLIPSDSWIIIDE